MNPAALDGLSAAERERVIEVLQSATMDGGVHLVQTIAATAKPNGDVSLEELRTPLSRLDGDGRASRRPVEDVHGAEGRGLSGLVSK